MVDDSSDRFYTKVPRVGVGVVVLRETGEREVLLVRRAKEPARGMWSLPGGAVELGETVVDAALREVREETGLVVEPGPVFTTVDAIFRDDDDTVSFHYVIAEVLAFADSAATPVPADDVSAVRWVPVAELPAVSPLTERVPAVVQQALRLLDAGLVERS